MATQVTLPNNRVVKIRNIFAPLGLGIITFGIYLLYWYYTINDELKADGEDVSPGVALFAVTLGVLLIVPPFVSFYNTCKRIESAQKRHGVTSRISPPIGLVLSIVFPFGLYPYVQSGLNDVWDAAANTTVGEPNGGGGAEGRGTV